MVEYPLEAAGVGLSRGERWGARWTDGELRVVRWLARQQAGGAVGMLVESEESRAGLLRELVGEGRRLVPDLQGQIVRSVPALMPDIGMMIIEADGLAQEWTEFALDYFAVRRQPGGMLVWRVGAEPVLRYLETLGRFFELGVVAGTQLVMVDLGELETG